MAGTPTTAAIRTKLGELLMSPAAQQIDFYLDRFHVDGSGLSYVALALLSPPKPGHGLFIRVDRMPPNREAQYLSATNTYLVPSANYGATPFQRMTLIHESVHALRDAAGRKVRTTTGLSSTLALSDEAAAILAGALFYIFDNTPVGTTPTTPSFATGTGVFGVAFQLALKMRTQMGFAVNPQDAKSLRDAVMNDKAYTSLKSRPKTTYPNDGLRL
jgi:hypothetical protein